MIRRNIDTQGLFPVADVLLIENVENFSIKSFFKSESSTNVRVLMVRKIHMLKSIIYIYTTYICMQMYTYVHTHISKERS